MKLFIKFVGTVVYIQVSLRSMVRKCCILIAGDEFERLYEKSCISATGNLEKN